MQKNLELNKKIGKRIRERRQNANISSVRMASMLNISQTYLSFIERGERGTSLHNYISIARILRMSLDELILGDGNEAIDEIKFTEKDRLISYLDGLSNSELNFFTQLIDQYTKILKNTLKKNKKSN